MPEPLSFLPNPARARGRRRRTRYGERRGDGRWSTSSSRRWSPSGVLATSRRSSRHRSGTRSGSRLRHGYSTAGRGAAPCDVVRLALKPDPKENGAPAPKRPPRACYVFELRTRAVRALDGDSQSLLRCRKHVWRARSSYQYEFGREWTDPGQREESLEGNLRRAGSEAPAQQDAIVRRAGDLPQPSNLGGIEPWKRRKRR